MRHRLVLQRAFAALVTDRAVQRVVDEEELHHALLCLVGGLARQLGVHHHAGSHLERARGLRLRHRLEDAFAVWHGHVHQALAACAGRLEQRVVAESRNGDADVFSSPNHQGSLGDLGADAVNRHLQKRDELTGRSRLRGRHAVTSWAGETRSLMFSEEF